MVSQLHTALSEHLGCRHPVVQTAMGWVADAGLVAATGNAGGFGFLAAVTLPPEAVEPAIVAVRERSDAPFGINLHLSQPNAEQGVDLAIRHRLRAVSYSRTPVPAMVKRLKAAGVLCVPTVGALRHAVKAVDLGADLVTVQGGEGGGHTGAVPTTVLLPQVIDAVRVPVIASGGFYDGRGLAAALAYGAAGVAMGTRFLMTRESPVPRTVLARYLATRDPAAIAVSTALDGLPLRLIGNRFLRQLEAAGPFRRLLIGLRSAWRWRVAHRMSLWAMLRAAWLQRQGGATLQQTLLAANAPEIIQRAIVHGDPDSGVLPAGQVAALIDELDTCAVLIEEMVHTALQCLRAPLQAASPVCFSTRIPA